MRLLLVASDRMEFRGILARAREVRPASLPVDWARFARLAGHDVLLVANGVGVKRAAAAVDVAAAAFRPEAVVSTGFRGALDESLAVGEIVVADRIIPDGRVADLTQPHCRRATVYTIDHVAQTAEEKLRLRATGASAVEMEAAGVASRAAALCLPFYCVKAVTDLAGETLANNYNKALRADGHFDTIFLLRSALRRPFARLPEVIRLRSRCVRAARALGDFFADCRF